MQGSFPPAAKRARNAALAARVKTIPLSSSIGVIWSAVAGAGGKLFLGTGSALWVFEEDTKDGLLTLLAGHPSEEGFQDGQGVEARFNIIAGLALERDGSVLVSDKNNHCLRHVSQLGRVTTFVCGGQGQYVRKSNDDHQWSKIFAGLNGFTDGVGSAVRFREPWGVVIVYPEGQPEGLAYVADTGNHCIRKVTLVGRKVSTLCGKGQEAGCVNGSAAEARFNTPMGLALDMNDDLIVADSRNHCVRKVLTDDQVTVTTVAGPAQPGSAMNGFADGQSTAARFNEPHAVALDGNNAILVADASNHSVRMIASNIAGGRVFVTTLAGNIEAGNRDGEGPVARFSRPVALIVNKRGQIAVSEKNNPHCLRKVEASLAAPISLLTGHETANDKALRALQASYSKVLDDPELADVTFAVDGQRFSAHRIILAAQSEHFKALLTSGQGMREGGSTAAGGDIALEGVSAGAFRVLLRYLYTQQLPKTEDCGEGLALGEMAKAADYFQVEELFQHCVEQFKRGLQVDNVVERLVLAHDMKLEALEEAAMEFLRGNPRTFQAQVFKCFMCARAAPVLCHDLDTDSRGMWAERGHGNPASVAQRSSRPV